MKQPVIVLCSLGVSTLTVVACGTQSSAPSFPSTNRLPVSTSPLPSSAHFTPSSITFVNANVGYASGNIVDGTSSTGCIYQTVDGGHTWKRLLEKGTAVSNVAAFGHDIWVCVKSRQNGGLYFSKNQGKTFTNINSVDLGNMDFTSRNVGWAVSQNETSRKTMILKTMDGGKHWAQVQLPSVESGGSDFVGFSNPKNGWLLEAGQPGAGNQGKALLRTTNGGQTWDVISHVQIGENGNPNQLGSGGYADGIDAVPAHPSSAYIWESRGPLIDTSDVGKSWHVPSITKPEGIEARGVSMQTVKDGFVLLQDMAHQGYSLEHTTDGGGSWEVVYKWSYS